MTTGVWKDTAPYSESPKDRWLSITWAARHFKIDRDTLLGWCRDGTVVARQKPTSGNWLVRERSLRAHLFGSYD